MTDTLTQLSTEESRAVADRRKRGNVVLMIALLGFVCGMFFLSFAHIQREGRPSSVTGDQITDQ
jgi:hypothetical protein